MAKEELYTAGKLSQEWGVPPKSIKDAIAKLGIEPDVKKGACNYFVKATADKIKAEVKK